MKKMECKEQKIQNDEYSKVFISMEQQMFYLKKKVCDLQEQQQFLELTIDNNNYMHKELQNSHSG
jgi:hypothetical protein